MKTRILPLIFTVALVCTVAPAQTPAPEDPAHEELRSLRTRVIEAITKGDFDTVLAAVHPDAVITWQNNEVCRGHQGLKAFFDKTGKDAFKGYKVPPTPAELTILHGGDTGISFGETVASYHLLGRDFELKSRWTATVVKENGKWLLAGYHVSMNVLDNPILNAATSLLYWVAAIALFVGLLVGRFLVGRRAA